MSRRPVEPSSARAATTASARCDSRRYTPVVPAADVHEVARFHTDVFAIVQPDLPAIVASRVRTANDTRQRRVPSGEHRIEDTNQQIYSKRLRY